MDPSTVLVILLAVTSLLGTGQFFLHQYRVRQIPIRVHVNGTRGKSSVTRLIGAGLRAGGFSTLVKVTGTFPRLILEDGREIEIHRRSGANILEQLEIVNLARRRRADALVIECMALQPRCQWITEHQMIHATAGVLTNVRLDHCDVMGETIGEITTVLASTIPTHAEFFTAEDREIETLRSHALQRGSRFHAVDGRSLTAEDMARFDYLEHPDNVGLALSICAHFGIEREKALTAMAQTQPDAGALTRSRIKLQGLQIDFWNAFAANDPDSTWRVWQRLAAEGHLHGTRTVVLNTRRDRGDRSRQLIDLVRHRLESEIDHLVVMGDDSASLCHRLLLLNFPSLRLHDAGTTPPLELIERMTGLIEERATVVGIGNIGGRGAELVLAFEKTSAEPCPRRNRT